MKHVPRPVRTLLGPIWRKVRTPVVAFKNSLLDSVDALRGTRNPLVPPRNMMFVGDGDYEKTGVEFLAYFRDLGGLRPNDRVLDIGCGIGRMSVPLTGYLSKEGAYHGFDIVKMGIDWCNQNIASRYPNFHYSHADIYNAMYNPTGTHKSSEFRFMYEDNFFDFIFLTSVFTHMYNADVRRYVAEISRVIKHGGRCLISCFLINQESAALIKAGRSTQFLAHPLDENSYTRDMSVPEGAIGFNEGYFIALCAESKLKLSGTIRYGSWCGREHFTSYQDLVIVRKD